MNRRTTNPTLSEFVPSPWASSYRFKVPVMTSAEARFYAGAISNPRPAPAIQAEVKNE